MEKYLNYATHKFLLSFAESSQAHLEEVNQITGLILPMACRLPFYPWCKAKACNWWSFAHTVASIFYCTGYGFGQLYFISIWHVRNFCTFFKVYAHFRGKQCPGHILNIEMLSIYIANKQGIQTSLRKQCPILNSSIHCTFLEMIPFNFNITITGYICSKRASLVQWLKAPS